jgi:hypothetical protein
MRGEEKDSMKKMSTGPVGFFIGFESNQPNSSQGQKRNATPISHSKPGVNR